MSGTVAAVNRKLAKPTSQAEAGLDGPETKGPFDRYIEAIALPKAANGAESRYREAVPAAHDRNLSFS